ncbi:MAG: RNA methyltransferase [Phycisphaeraceae bacterium]
MLVPIHDPADPRLDPYRHMKGRDPAAEQGLFIVESQLLVRRLLESNFETISVLAVEKQLASLVAMVPEHVPVHVAPQAFIDTIVGFHFHRGVMALARRPDEDAMTIERLLPATTLVACPFINQHENLGLIMRTCAGLGADGLIYARRGADPYYRRSVRVSTGAVFTLPMAASLDPVADLRRLKEERGFALIAAALTPDALPLAGFARSDRVALVVGSEYDGVPPDILAMCDHQLIIPMHRGVDSLNVGVAMAIVLHELLRHSSASSSTL